MENKHALPVLFLVLFFVMIGFGIIIPILPFYAEQLGATPEQLGLLMASYSVMQFLFSPLWGRLSERIGRKPVLILGIGGLSLSFFIMAEATELWMLFAARILGGLLSSANMPATMAYVADITPPENRGKGMGMMGAAVGLGFIFGPAVGGSFSKFSLSLPFTIAGISSLLTLLLVIFLLKESLPKGSRPSTGIKEGSRWKALAGPDALMFLIQGLVSLALAGLETTFALFSAVKAGLDSVRLGYIFMMMGVTGAIVQGGLLGTLTKRFGELKVISFGLLVSAFGFGLLLLTRDFWTAALFITFFGLGNGVIRPAVNAYMTKRTTAGHGHVTGLLSSFDSLGRILGPPLGGWLFAFHIYLPYISGALLSIVAFILVRRYRAKIFLQQQ